MPNRSMSALEADVQGSIEASLERRRAEHQADRIKRFWRARGRSIDLHVIEEQDGDSIICRVVSKSVNGWPL